MLWGPNFEVRGGGGVSRVFGLQGLFDSHTRARQTSSGDLG